MYWSVEQHSLVLQGLSFDFYWASHQLLQPARPGAQNWPRVDELMGSWPKSAQVAHDVGIFFLGIRLAGNIWSSKPAPDVCGSAAKVQKIRRYKELSVIWSKLSSRWWTLRFFLVQIWCSPRFLNLFDGFWFWILFFSPRATAGKLAFRSFIAIS